jgi:acid stress chaperone HdeB
MARDGRKSRDAFDVTQCAPAGCAAENNFIDLKDGAMSYAKFALAAVVVLLADSVRAQVTIDISRITCNQYLSFTVADPRDIAIWLSGYYHGKRGATALEPQELKRNADRLKDACFLKENMDLPVMQVIDKVLSAGR